MAPISKPIVLVANCVLASQFSDLSDAPTPWAMPAAGLQLTCGEDEDIQKAKERSLEDEKQRKRDEQRAQKREVVHKLLDLNEQFVVQLGVAKVVLAETADGAAVEAAITAVEKAFEAFEAQIWGRRIGEFDDDESRGELLLMKRVMAQELNALLDMVGRPVQDVPSSRSHHSEPGPVTDTVREPRTIRDRIQALIRAANAQKFGQDTLLRQQ